MTNPSPRPALRKAEDATVHPAAPRPARAPRSTPPADAEGGPRTIADTNREANAAAAARAKKPKGAPPATPTAPKAARKKGKFSGSTSDHMRVPDTEFTEHPEPTRKRRSSTASTQAAPATTAPELSLAAAPDLMTGKIVELGARVPKKLRTAAKHEAKRRGLDLDAVTTELLHTWLTSPR